MQYTLNIRREGTPSTMAESYEVNASHYKLESDAVTFYDGRSLPVATVSLRDAAFYSVTSELIHQVRPLPQE